MMPAQIVSDEQIIAALKQTNGNRAAAARLLGVTPRCVVERATIAANRGLPVPPSTAEVRRKNVPSASVTPSATLSIPTLPDGKIDIGELIDRRRKAFARKSEAHEARKLVTVRVKEDAPIAVVMLGDPHVDDDGTDLGRLADDIDVINRTPGMFAGCIGDVQNNWVGRLARLYANQETTASQSWQLVEWFVESLSQKWLFMVAGNHDCHDMQTEALTKRGWLKYNDILPTDEVLSLDIETGSCDWYPIIGRIDRDNTEQMVSIEAQSLSALMTPNHRVLHKKRGWNRRWSELKYCKAYEIPARFSLPVSGESSYAEADINDDWISLTGWLLTDGSILNAKRGTKRVCFYQSKPDSGLEGILARLGLSHSMTVRERDITSVCGRPLVNKPLPQREYRMTAESCAKILEVVPEKRKVPDWAFSLSDRQFEVLLRALIAGDGSFATNGKGTSCVLHGEKALLDSVQALAVCHGWSASISIAREKDYRLNLCKRSVLELDRSSVVSTAPPSSKVWCLTVPLGNFMVRRNGKAHFSGNCWSGNNDPMKWIQKQAGVMLTGDHTVRLALRFPSGTEVRIAARHDWPGNSMWNPSHGQLRAANLTHHDHIIVSGHKHTGGYQLLRIPASGLLAHCVQLGSYKIHDSYADELGLPPRMIAPSCTAIIDPHGSDISTVRIEHDIEAAADYMTWLRARRL